VSTGILKVDICHIFIMFDITDIKQYHLKSLGKSRLTFILDCPYSSS